jgi:L-threonylcarbamoyladenylate synthase
MRHFTSLADPKLIRSLMGGGVVVIPTDTVYGIVARAGDKIAVERMYRLRGRNPEKPCIMLVADTWQIKDTTYFSDEYKHLADKYWPGPLSLVCKVSNKTPEYLHRGTHTLAYRVPNSPELRALLRETGPLLAPSANPQDEPTATTITEAQDYFADDVDGYVDDGTLEGRAPSTVVTITTPGELTIIRQGALRII